MKTEDFNIDDLRSDSVPYRVPEGYFEGQEQRLLNIAATARRKSRPMRLSMIISAAASVAVVAALGIYLFSGNETPADLDSYIASLSDSELSSSIALDDYDTYSEYLFNEDY